MRDYDSLNLRRLVPIAAIAIPIAVVAVLLANVQNLPFAREAMAWMRGVGGEWWALPLFVVLYFVCTLLLLPPALLSVAASLAWGWQLGGLFDVVTCTLAALPPYAIARRGLPPRVTASLARHGISFTTTPDFFPLLLLRIVPVVPYVALNYIAGLARFRVRDYLVATFFGSIPSAFLFAFFIDTLGDSATGAATQLRIAGACAAVALLAIIGRWGARFVARTVRRPDGGGLRSASPERPPE